jgi:NitT/TauT family transport system substrate-binding protein
MKKIIVSIVVVVLLIAAGVGGYLWVKAQDKPASADVVNVVVPDGAPLLSMVGLGLEGSQRDGKFAVSDDAAKDLGHPTQVQMVTDADQLSASLMKDRPELAVVPINLAAKLYNTDQSYKMLGVSTWGLNEIVSNQDITSLDDLKGKKVYSFGASTTPGLTLRTLLEKAGLKWASVQEGTDTTDPEAVTLVDLTSGADVVAALSKLGDGEEGYGLVPEPAASAFGAKSSAAGGKFGVKLNLQQVWQTDFDGEQYPQAALIVRSDFAGNPDNAQFLKNFITEVSASEQLVKTNADQAVQVAKDSFGSAGLAAGAPITAATAAGRLRLTFGATFGSATQENIPEQTQAAVSNYLAALAASEDGSKIIGGKVPDSGFYAQLG